MKKKILIMSFFALVVMMLPLIPMAEAKKGGVPTEMYRDLMVWGSIIPDGSPALEDIWERGNIQSASYTAQSYYMGSPGIGIFWDGPFMAWNEQRFGTAIYEIEYTINTETMRGVVHIWTEVDLGDGGFVGDMFWVGKLQWRIDYDDTVRMVNTGMWHSGWQGTGAYDGWKIIQNMNANPPWTDTMMGIMAGDCHLIKPVDE